MLLTRKGLELDPGSEHAVFGHLVLADIWRRRHLEIEYEEEMKKGQELQKRLGTR